MSGDKKISVVVAVHDKTPLGEVEDAKVEITNYTGEKGTIREIVARHSGGDLYLIHPYDPFDETWRETAVKLILYSGDYRELDEWLEEERVVCVSKGVLQTNWRKIVHEFAVRGSLKDALVDSFAGARVENAHDRHRERNREGARQLLMMAREYGDISDATVRMVNAALLEREKQQNKGAAEVIRVSGETGWYPSARVLMIDDEHWRGWSEVFSILVHGATAHVKKLREARQMSGTRPAFWVVEHVGNKEEGDLHDLCRLLRCTEEQPREQLLPIDMVLLDFRVHDERTDMETRQVSGYRIAQVMRKIDPTVPIIMVTASERVETLIALQQHNVLGYYLKPRTHDTLENTLSYVQLRKAVRMVAEGGWYRGLWHIRCTLGEGRLRVREKFRGAEFAELVMTAMDHPCDDSEEYLIDAMMRALEKAVARLSEAHLRGGALIEGMYSDAIIHLGMVSDILTGMRSPYNNMVTSFQEDEVMLWCANVARVLRNIVAHGNVAFVGRSDVMLIALCIVWVLCEDIKALEATKVQTYGYDASPAPLAAEEMIEQFCREACQADELIRRACEGLESGAYTAWLLAIVETRSHRRKGGEWKANDWYSLRASYWLLYRAVARQPEAPLYQLLHGLLAEVLTNERQ